MYQIDDNGNGAELHTSTIYPAFNFHHLVKIISYILRKLYVQFSRFIWQKYVTSIVPIFIFTYNPVWWINWSFIFFNVYKTGIKVA